jgi:hypothetical protein
MRQSRPELGDVSCGEVVSFDNFLRDHLREIENISAKVLAKK